MNYDAIIRGALTSNYPDKETTSLLLSHLNIKFIPLRTQSLLEQYGNVEVLTITHCHLRNLEHFPKLKSVTQLNLSHN